MTSDICMQWHGNAVGVSHPQFVSIVLFWMLDKPMGKPSPKGVN